MQETETAGHDQSLLPTRMEGSQDPGRPQDHWVLRGATSSARERSEVRLRRSTSLRSCPSSQNREVDHRCRPPVRGSVVSETMILRRSR
jgi:hypothetical protein